MKRLVCILGLAACAHSNPGGNAGDPDAGTDPAIDGSNSGSDAADLDAAPMPPSSFGFDGSELPICTGSYHAPTMVLGDNRLVVGCMPSGSQNTTPIVKFMMLDGTMLGQASLLTSDGYYYKETRLSHHDGKFQAIYEYNCDDNGSWLVGWGWGCIELRELDDTGDQITAIQFGETGHNGHPVLDASGSELGVAWVSYDDAYFRRLDAARDLPGGRGANLLLGPDPLQSDARSAARTQIVYDGAGYGVFTIIGTHMYFSRVEAADHIAVAMKDLGTAYSQTFSGELSAVAAPDGTYVVAYDDTASVKLVNFDRNGDVVKSVVAQAGAYTAPQLVASGGRYYVVTEDAGGRGYITVFDGTLTKVGDGLIGGGLGRTMVHPTLAVDGTTWMVAYQDAQGGNVIVQKLAPMP